MTRHGASISFVRWALAVMLIAAPAAAVPATLPFTGRLANSAGPLNGSVAITFRLFDVATGGAALWTETLPSVTAVNGLVSVELGTLTTLDAAVFNGQPRWLELTIGTETLAPRIKLATIPYAFRTDTADHLGALSEPDVQRRVMGTCAANAAIRSIDQAGQVQCTTSSGVTAGNGIAVSGSTVSLSASGCGIGSVWKYDGAQFSCVPDQVGPTYSAGPGISLASNVVSLNTSGCVSGEVLHFNGAGWDCTPDAVTTDATQLATGTLSTNLYSAYADLSAEGYFGNNANTDLLNRAECDARYLQLSGGALSGALLVTTSVTVGGEYAYSTPHTRYSGVGALQFVPGDESIAFGSVHGGSADRYISACGIAVCNMVAPVQLPHGAVVTGLSCKLYDNDASKVVSISLVRHAGGMSTFGTGCQVDTTIESASVQTSSAACNVTIDSQNNSYFLQYFHGSTGTVCSGSPAGSNCRVYLCNLTYTTTRSD